MLQFCSRMVVFLLNVHLIVTLPAPSLGQTEQELVGNSTKSWFDADHMRSLSVASEGKIKEDQEALKSWANLLSNDTASNVGFAQQWKDERKDESDASPCGWVGVLCRQWAGELRVVGLNLSNFNLTGPMPQGLGKLAGLQSFLVAVNSFTGIIPSDIGRCSDLKVLDLSSNDLSGDIISDVIGPIGCSQLTHIDLSSNKFRGAITPEIGNCTQLQQIVFQNNNLTGSIPEQLGELQHLECLGLGSNYLSGALPKSLLRCRRLWAINVSRNRLSGELPGWLGEMGSLRYFTAHENNFSGGIPPELGRAPMLVHIDVGLNNLSGAIPPEIANVTTLRLLRLAGNHLIGSMPPSLGNLSRLQVLDLSANGLSGPIPPSFGSLQNLRLLQMAGNQLNGSIPGEITNCWSLAYLNVRNNRLSGELPRDFFSLGSNASASFMTKQEVDAYPPMSFAECSLIQSWVPGKHFLAFGFQIQGLKADPVCRAQWLTLLTLPSIACGYWQLSNNSLSGRIPAPVRKTPNLSCLMLSHNNLSGSIPSNISLVPLCNIELANNHINGAIPDIFKKLSPFLQNLDLSDNNLSGALPESLNELDNLWVYNFSCNPELEGPVPNEGPFLNFDPTAYLSNAKLCRDQDPTETTGLHQTMRFCDTVEVPSLEPSQPPSTANETGGIFLDMSIPGFVLGAGLGFFIMCIVYHAYWFSSPPGRARKRRDHRVGDLWRPPT